MGYKYNIKVVKNDYGYNLPLKALDEGGTVVNLTDATSIKLKVALPDATTCLFIGTCTADDAVNGLCHYTVQSGDFDTVETYNAELKITYTTKVITCRGLSIRVLKELPAT